MSLTIIGTSDVRGWYLIRTGSVHQIDISSNTQKVHGRILWANPVTISHFLCVSHYYWNVGRPGLVSDPGPDLSTKWISPQIHKKYTGVLLWANPVTISHFLCVPHYYWGVGRPGSVSDPGPDLSTKWISPPNTPKVHGRILWANPVTISHFLGVPHYYWGVGRPEWVSGTTPTTVPCSPSGWQFYLYVGYRTTLAQSPNQCQIDWWFNDTFLLNRKQIYCT